MQKLPVLYNRPPNWRPLSLKLKFNNLAVERWCDPVSEKDKSYQSTLAAISLGVAMALEGTLVRGVAGDAEDALRAKIACVHVEMETENLAHKQRMARAETDKQELSAAINSVKLALNAASRTPMDLDARLWTLK